LLFSLPPELEFIERGFGLSPLHDPDEGIISYVRAYPRTRELTLTFDIGAVSLVLIRLSEASASLCELSLERVCSLAFQSWHGERTIRVGFEREFSGVDLRLHYDPLPSVHLASVASGA
jgi:hypothetical protein